MTSSKKAFTLIELIVVITILAILGSIGFNVLTGYFAGARDGARLADMKSIYKQLNLALGTDGQLPIPENARTIMLSGTTIAYQGYVGKNTLGLIKFEGAGRDPKDNAYYTYTMDSTQKFGQLMGYFEEYDTSKLSNSITPATSLYNATYGTYTNRRIGTIGKNVCIMTESGSLAPVQATSTGNLDILTSGTGYVVYCDSNTAKNGSGVVLANAFLGNSVVYNTGTVSGSNWSIAYGGDCTDVSNGVGLDGNSSTCFDNRTYSMPVVGMNHDRIYSLLKIEGHWWFNENIGYPRSTGYSASNIWSTGDTGLYSCPGIANTATTNCTLIQTGGFLYQWSAAMLGSVSNNDQTARTQGICPNGWAIPTELDFTSTGSTFWPDPIFGGASWTGNTIGWNSSYIGYRNSVGTGTFIASGTDERLWSSFQNSGTMSWREWFSTSNPSLSQHLVGTKASGFSVRCIKN